MKITLCGSYAFQAQMEEMVKALEAAGHEVKLPRLEVAIHMPDGSKVTSIAEYIVQKGGVEALLIDDIVWHEKGKAIDDHVAKVVWADAILVVNFEKKGIKGYIGGNTLMEIAVARHRSKKIFLMERPSPQLSYVEEILGCEPVIIEGDLSKIA